MPHHTLRTAAALLAAAPFALHAAEIGTLQNLNQSEFNLLTKDLGAATAYRQLASAAPLGVTGFDIAIGSSFTRPQYPDIWSKAAGGADIPSTIPVPGVRLAKGLPFGIDIGATLTTVPKVDANLAGIELRWAPLEGGLVYPAIGVRVAHTRLSGVDQLKLSNTSLDVSISKGFPFITPYAGIGVVRTDAEAVGVTTLAKESPSQTRAFVGAHLNLGLFDITAEGDRTGKTDSYSVRLGFRF